MPNKEFKCPQCGVVFTKLVRPNVTSVRCIACGHYVADQIVSVPARTRVGKYGKGGGSSF